MKRVSSENNYCVYMHENKLNGKKYIGQTYNIKERWRCNGKNYFASIKFFNALKKYGWDNFNHIIIKDKLYRDEADSLEKELIEKYDTINNGYNLKEGGSRGDLSKDSLKKMSESLLKSYAEHPERKEKIRQKALGRVSSEKAKKNLLFHSMKKAILIDINGEIGSIRYWAKRIGMTHPPLLYQKNKYGLDALIQYIKDRMPTTNTQMV